MTTPTTVNVQFQLRADTAANWTAENPTLLANEFALETDTKKLKVGDGSTAWASLAYFPSIVSGGTVLGNLEIGSTGTLTFEGSTANDYETTLAVTDPTADRTITLPDQSGTVVVSGNASIVDADIAANAEIAVSKLANGTANQVLVTDGTDVSWSDNLTLAGDLTVNGTTTTINTQDLLVEDKNIIIGNVDTPTDLTADGGGITLKGAVDKTINWIDATDAWTSSEHIELASGKSYRINNTEVLSATTLGSGVTGSSLTSVGTITAGTWQGTAIDAAYLDSTVVTTGDTGTVTSTMIADGTIVNADVSGTAAIAGSKIDPDFGSQTIETTGDLAINTNTLFVDASANAVGVGTTSPGQLLHLSSSGNPKIYIERPGQDAIELGINSGETPFIGCGTDLGFRTGGTTSADEAARIDSSGRLLVGTSSARSVVGVTSAFQVEGTGYDTSSLSLICNANSAGIAPNLILGKSRGTSVGSNTIVQSGDTIGDIAFAGADGSDLGQYAAKIAAEVDGTPGADDMPGRLVFSTTADGASSPTERMRIHNNGDVGIGLTGQYPGDGNTTNGVYFENNGKAFFSKSASVPLLVNRNTDDGTLVEFRQAGTLEGTISVSGTTVSYNGAHLSRWSQLPSGAERTEILRGTVLSNIDEMCEWGEEDNEQLNRMKVSDVEGDKNVSGVFQAWDDDDDTYTNDFYCAMTGDFVIRIAQGTTVTLGDLLMSAGDGTAKPQDDDIIRSKTIAKVTSTNVSCTYDDGSYCVPCVLMAC